MSLLARLKKSLLQPQFISYRTALVIFLLVQLVYFSPIFFRGWIINPHDGDLNTALANTCNLIRRNYLDESIQFIPSIHHQIYSDSKSWLPSWIPNVELGRPFTDAWASKEFLLSNILIRLGSDPKQVFTWFVVFNYILGGIFIFVFLQDLELHPLAVLVVSLLYSFSPFNIKNQVWPMFLGTGTWFFGLLWAVRKFIQQPNWQRGALLSFITYCALFIVRKVNLIYMFYILGFYVLFLVFNKISDKKERIRILFYLGLVVLSGAVAYTPSLLDLQENIQNSLRVEEVNNEWLIEYLPVATSLESSSLMVHTFFDGYWFGQIHFNIKDIDFLKFRSYSVVPPIGFLLLFAFRRKVLRRAYGWLTLFAFSTIATYSTPLFLFLAHHLGLGLSRSNPFLWGTYAAWVIAAYALDNLLQENRKITWIEVFLLVVVIANGIFVYLNYSEQLSMNYVYFSALITFGMLIFVRFRWPAILLFLTFTSIYVYSYRMMLWDNPACYDLNSPIAQQIKLHTNNDERFAWVGKAPIRANQEILYGLKSIHTFNSISSRAYNEMVYDISGLQLDSLGRRFLKFKNANKFRTPVFRLTNIGLIVSSKLPPKVYKVIDRFQGFYFFRPQYEPIPYLQLNNFQIVDSEATITVPSKEILPQPVVVLEKKDDYLRLKLNKRKVDSLLFISQQYHSKWFAKNGTGEKLPTVRVNGLYQGVLIPPSTGQVVLQYRSWAYYSFIPQTIYLLLGFFALYQYIKNKIQKL